MAQKVGNQTFVLDRKVYWKEGVCIVGPKEKEGPLGKYFDQKENEDFGEDTWEKAEARFVEATYAKLLAKSQINENMVDCIFAGDLLNQCIATGNGLKKNGRPYFGLYGACSTMAESLILASLLIDGGGVNNAVCLTSSNFASAEKQFRFPMELGNQRAPDAQWTVTGAGACLLSSNNSEESCPVIVSVTPGKMVNYEVKDVNNMGAAMAPAAAFTIQAHLSDLNLSPDYYDMIVTGDLGITGKKLCMEVLKKNGLDIDMKDCGEMIFDPEKQGTCAGGSGCACSAVVLNGYILRKLREAAINKVLFVATGALMSPVSTKQGESIIGIAHAVSIQNM